jgi:hypothetical protein
MKVIEFESEFLKVEDINAGYFEFPYDVHEYFGKKGQIRVYAEVNGYKFRGALAKMGNECHFLGLKKEQRLNARVNYGDIVNVKVWEDNEVRNVDIPEDFEDALKSFQNIKEFFDNMSYTHRKEFVEWINSAKKDETRVNRIDKAINMLIDKLEQEKHKKKRK